MELIRYLIEAIPQSIETPSKEGWTPLLLAFSLNRFHAAQVLIEAGANQRRRDKLGRNIMHLAFADINEDLKSQTVEVKKMIELTDRRAVQELSVERCTVDPGALTPLGRWLYCLQRRFDSDLSAKRDVLELILGLSDGADLEMMDGSGQLPLHVAVKASYHKLVSCIIERNPALLYRENATGPTPLELAETMWLQHHIDNPPVLQGGQYFYRKLIQNQEPEFFLHDRKADDPKVIKTWHVCKEAVKKYSRKRKLVSLNEANEVSKRLAKKQRKENDREDKNQDGEEKAIEFKHELLEWYQRASLADNSPG